jgi:hypothetical protein
MLAQVLTDKQFPKQTPLRWGLIKTKLKALFFEYD